MKFDVVAVNGITTRNFAWTSYATRSFHDEIIHMIWNQIVMLATAIFSQATSLIFFISYFPCLALLKDFRSSSIPETELPLFRERPSRIDHKYAGKKFAKAGKATIFGVFRSD